MFPVEDNVNSQIFQTTETNILRSNLSSLIFEVDRFISIFRMVFFFVGEGPRQILRLRPPVKHLSKVPGSGVTACGSQGLPTLSSHWSIDTNTVF